MSPRVAGRQLLRWLPAPTSMMRLVLLYAADDPARFAVHGFFEVPQFTEWRRGAVAIFTNHAAEAYRSDITVTFGEDLENFRIERDNICLVRRVAACLQLVCNLRIQRGRHEIAHR